MQRVRNAALRGSLFYFFGNEVLYDFTKTCRKGKKEVFKNGGTRAYPIFSEKGKLAV